MLRFQQRVPAIKVDRSRLRALLCEPAPYMSETFERHMLEDAGSHQAKDTAGERAMD